MVDDDKQRWLVRDVGALMMVIDSETTMKTDLRRISVDTKRGNRDNMALAESAVTAVDNKRPGRRGITAGRKGESQRSAVRATHHVLDNR